MDIYGNHVTTVEMRRADEVLATEGAIDFLKIDVECAVYLVFKSFREVLRRMRFMKLENHAELFEP